MVNYGRGEFRFLMKKLAIFSVFFIFLAVGVWGETTYTWTGNGGNTNWSDPDNWDDDSNPVTDYYPGENANDDIVIIDDGSVDLNIPSVTIASLTIGAAGELTISNNLDVTGGTISNGGILTLGAQTVTAATITNSGTLSLDGNGNLLPAGNHTNMPTGTVEFTGTGSLSGITIFNNLTILSGTQTTVNTLTVNGIFTHSGTLLSAASLSVTGITTIGGNVTTTGTQTYTGAVTLGAAVNLTANVGSLISFVNTVNGGNGLTITNANVQFTGVVGGTTRLTSLDVTAGTSVINANISTTGAQTYTGAVTLGNGITFTANTGSLIWFKSTVRSNNATARTLTITTANVQFDGDVGDVGTPISTVSVNNGTAQINADITTSSTTGTTQRYYGPVILGANVTFTGGAAASIIRFDGAVTTTGAYTITVSNATTRIVTSVTTTADQTYNGDVRIGTGNNGPTLAAGAGNTITFGSTVANTVGSSNATRPLTVTSGNVIFHGTVGGTGNPVSNLAINGGGSTTINANVTTTGNQSYTGDVTLGGAGTRILASSGGYVTITGDVSETIANSGITVNASRGITMDGASTIGGNVTLNNNQGTVAGDISFINTSTSINLTTVNNRAGTITIDQTGALSVTSASTLANGSINLTAKSGSVTQTGVISTGTLNASSGGVITLNNVNSIATLNVTAATGAVQFTNNAALAIAGVSGLTGATPADRNVTITTTGTGSNVTQTGAITTTEKLTLNSSGTITLNAANNVGTLDITGAGGAVQFTNNAYLIIDNITALPATAAGAVAITTGENQNISINGAINCFSLALKAGTSDSSTGTVSINAPITVSSPNASAHNEDAAVYIKAGTLAGTGTNNISLTSAGWVCADLLLGYSYSGNVTVPGGIHFHTRLHRDIVYRIGADDDTFYSDLSNYFYIQADSPNLGTVLNVSALGNGNIYIIDVGNSTNASTREVTFSTVNGFIEIRGNYTSSETSTVNSGNNVVRFKDSTLGTTVLNLPSFDLSGETLHLLGGNTAFGPASITTTGNIQLGTITSGEKDGTNHLTLDSGGFININGTVGASSIPIDRIGDITVKTAINEYITFNGAVYANSYTQTVGNATILADQNYYNAFSLSNILTIEDASIVTNNSGAGISVGGNTNIAGGVILNTQAGNGPISLTNVTGTDSLEMTAGNGVIDVTGQIGTNDTNRIGDLTASAMDITFGANVFAADVSVVIDNNIGAKYLQSGSVIANSFTQTLKPAGSVSTDETVSLNGDITVTAANRANAYIKFASTADFTQPLTFSVPSLGGIVDLDNGASGDFQLTLTGGSSDTASLELSKDTDFEGNIVITAGSYVKLSNGITITQNGTNLTLQAGTTTLDTSAGSWHLGTSGTPSGDFAGIDGTLTLGTGSKLIANDVNLTGSSFAVNNTGEATIIAKGNVIIESDPSFSTAELPQLIIKMDKDSSAIQQTLSIGQTLGSLHIGENSRTVLSALSPLTDTISFRGMVKILSVNAPAGLDAGANNIVMYAGLRSTRNTSNYTHNGSNPVSYTRWEITAAKISPHPPFTAAPNMNNFVFRQDADKSVEFKKDPASPSYPVYFEIAGDTLWQEFLCVEPGAVIQFSRHPDHHTILDKFSITGEANVSDSSNHDKYVTITRLTEPRGIDNYSPYPYIPLGGKVPPTIFGDLTPDALPAYLPPEDLKNDPSQEKQKYWNINLISDENHKPLQNFKYVKVYFSHAYNQRIPINTGMFVDAIPYYRPSATFGYFNFDWIQLKKILYSFTEDADGDGYMDRIRVQTNVVLNGNFSAFDIKVEDYEVDSSKGTRGYQLVSDITHSVDDKDSFYIYLKQNHDIDTGNTPLWSVIRNADSLMDELTELSLVGEPVGEPNADENIRPFDSIPPRVAYSLTLPDHPQTYVRMSEPVVSLTGAGAFDTFKGSGSSYLKDAHVEETSDSYEYKWQYFSTEGDDKSYKQQIDAANLGYILDLEESFGIERLSGLEKILNDNTSAPGDGYFQLDDMVDQAQRAMAWNDPAIDPSFFMYYQPPKYPRDWKYSKYAKVFGNGHLHGKGLANPDFANDEDHAIDIDNSDNNSNNIGFENVFIPPNKMLTVDMMTRLAEGGNVVPTEFLTQQSVIRRITDILVSLPPNKDDDSYFAWPVWARYQQPANPGNLSASEDFFGQTSADNGIIWQFDGTKFLEARDIEIQASVNKKLLEGLNLNLFWSSNIASEFRNPQQTADRGKGSGGLWLPIAQDDPLYYYVPLSDKAAPAGEKSSGSHLYNFTIDKDASGFNSGDKMDFVFRIRGTVNSSEIDFFAARLDISSGASIPEKWYQLVRPFSFDIQTIRLQRGGVTILNNVINSNNRENTYIRYHLVRGGRVTIQVYTLDGTLVKSLRRNEYRDAGEWSESWDGTNNGGRAVARGMYFVRVVGPDIDEIRKIMVIK